jgi:hypothetical protein
VISPEDRSIETVTALLRYFDWSPTARLPGVYEIWSPEDNEREELIIPLDEGRGDFRRLLDRAINALISQYGKAARDVVATLEMRTRAQLDETKWRKESALAAGLIGWEQGETLYGAARAQLIAAAKSAREPRRYHGHSSAHVARRFLDETLMGQTAAGSYIITAFTPANGRFYLTRSAEEHAITRPELFEEVVSGREILNVFESAVNAIRQGLDEYKRSPTVELFAETVQAGVSYEFARALSEILATGDTEIAIEKQRPGSERPIVANVAFDAVEGPILSSVAISFAEDPEPQDVTVVGEVTLLSRSSETSDRLIRLNIARGADVRKARVRLTAEQYELAMEAHQLEANLTVSGRLEREGNLYWLYDAREVALVSQSDEDDVAPRPQSSLLTDE